jgi:hypothetical protein
MACENEVYISCCFYKPQSLSAANYIISANVYSLAKGSMWSFTKSDFQNPQHREHKYNHLKFK